MPRKFNTKAIKDDVLIQLKPAKKDPFQPYFRNEGLRSCIFSENQKRKRRGLPTHDIHVINIQDFATELAILQETAKQNNTIIRKQIILNVNGHYLTIDVNISPQKKEAIVMDAAQDIRVLRAIQGLNDAGFDTIYVLGTTSVLQHTNSECGVFSLDHALQIADIDIYQHLSLLNQKSINVNDYSVDWLDCPPQLIWNAQSLSLLNKYQEKNPDKTNVKTPNGETLNEHLAKGKKIKSIKGEEKEVNASIEGVFELHRDSALNTVTSIPPTQLEKIVIPAYQLRLDFINELKIYQETRSKESRNQKSNYYSFFGRIGGYSAEKKINACNKMINYLLGNQEVKFTKEDIKILKDGRLGKLVESYSDVLLKLDSLTHVHNAPRP